MARVREMCTQCNGTGRMCAGNIILANQFGTTRKCRYCDGRGVREFEEFTEEEFRRKFPPGSPIRKQRRM